MTHIEVVREALAWHEYGSQDDRRRKALAALDSLEAELARLKVEHSEWERVVAERDEAREEAEELRNAQTVFHIAAEADREALREAREERDEARAALRRIAVMDYRGNEPYERQLAREFLASTTEEPPLDRCPTCGSEDRADDLLGVHETPDPLSAGEPEFCPDPRHTQPRSGE